MVPNIREGSHTLSPMPGAQGSYQLTATVSGSCMLSPDKHGVNCRWRPLTHGIEHAGLMHRLYVNRLTSAARAWTGRPSASALVRPAKWSRKGAHCSNSAFTSHPRQRLAVLCFSQVRPTVSYRRPGGPNRCRYGKSNPAMTATARKRSGLLDKSNRRRVYRSLQSLVGPWRSASHRDACA